MPVFHADDVTQVQDQAVPGAPRPPLPEGLLKKQDKPGPFTRYGREFLTQAKGTAKGAAEFAQTVSRLLPYTPAPGESIEKTLENQKEAQEKAGQFVKQTVKTPVRALEGKPQEGYPQESAPTGLARPIDALDLVLGNDPGKARLLEKSGDTAGAIAALTTGSLLFKGLESVLPGKPKPPFGPKPKSAIPPMRENIPSGTSATAERAMRTLRPGAYLPNEYERVKKLTSVIGTNDKVNVPEALKVVMPELDKTAREYAIPPKGVSATEGVTERPGTGKGVTPVETLNNLMQTTMGRLEGEYQAILQPAANDMVSTNSIATEIARAKTQGLIDMAAAAPDSEAAKTLKYLNEVENAFANKTLSLKSLDDLRQYYYTAARAGEAGRVAARSNEAVMADTATEEGLRNLIYDELERRSRAAGKDPGFIRDLKRKQANLYSLLDLGKQNATAYINEDAIKRGYDWLQNQNFTMAMHPPYGRLVGSLHGLGRKLSGEPESLSQAEKRVRQTFAQKGVPNTRTGKAAQSASNAAKAVTTQAVVGAIPKRQAPPTSVQMKTPDGTIRDIPLSQVDEAKKRGAVMVQ